MFYAEDVGIYYDFDICQCMLLSVVKQHAHHTTTSCMYQYSSKNVSKTQQHMGG